MSHFKTAQICLEGHIVTDCIEDNPGCEKHCRRCGQPTIAECATCHSRIRGLLVGEGCVRELEQPPAHCHECGQPYPWTTRKLEAAIQLAAECPGVTTEDAEALRQNAKDVICETTRTALAAHRYRQVLDKLGGAAATMAQRVLSGILCEVAKRQIWPQP